MLKFSFLFVSFIYLTDLYILSCNFLFKNTFKFYMLLCGISLFFGVLTTITKDFSYISVDVKIIFSTFAIYCCCCISIMSFYLILDTIWYFLLRMICFYYLLWEVFGDYDNLITRKGVVTNGTTTTSNV
jgi:hypothetical protein